MKIALNVIGSIAVVLAILGIFLPLLPTTPFLLLASGCFARGSTRMHGWLLGNKVCGKYIRDYEEGRGIPVRGKVTALLILWGSIGYSIASVQSMALMVILACIAAGVTIYLLGFVPTFRAQK
ncbi:MAG: YbaN family protein [Telluria sp.]